jgi:hypothetical protein
MEMLFTSVEAITLTALLERLFPNDELGPGAIETGVLDYIQIALGGPDAHLVTAYRLGLAAIDAMSAKRFGRAFSQLPTGQQDTLISLLEGGQIEGLDPHEAAMFFDIVWRHLREGLFSDPIHGGNRDMVGWQLIGFPGAQYGYTQEEQRLDTLIVREPKGVAALRKSHGAPEDSG